MTVGTDLGLYDVATGESIKAIKSVEIFTRGGTRTQLLFAQSKRGRIVQLRQGNMRIHYFYDEAFGRKMMDDDCKRFDLAPGSMYAAVIATAPPVNADPSTFDNGFVSYRRKQIAELRPYRPGETLIGVSISDVDRAAGSPKEGDMIARNPKNHDDKWLVAAAYFADNFEAV